MPPDRRRRVSFLSEYWPTVLLPPTEQERSAESWGGRHQRDTANKSGLGKDGGGGGSSNGGACCHSRGQRSHVAFDAPAVKNRFQFHAVTHKLLQIDQSTLTQHDEASRPAPIDERRQPRHVISHARQYGLDQPHVLQAIVRQLGRYGLRLGLPLPRHALSRRLPRLPRNAHAHARPACAQRELPQPGKLRNLT